MERENERKREENTLTTNARKLQKLMISIETIKHVNNEKKTIFRKDKSVVTVKEKRFIGNICSRTKKRNILAYPLERTSKIV